MYQSKKPYLYGTGRRKSSVARVHLFPNGTGAITINGSEEDVIARVKELTNGKGPEIILDAAGHYTVVEQAVEMVAKNGKIGITGLPAQASSIHMNPIAMRQISIIGSRAYERKHWRQGELGPYKKLNL